jgi:hypothetical protein
MNLHEYPDNPAHVPEYQVAVMAAHIKHKKPVQARPRHVLGHPEWSPTIPNPVWNWAAFDYRIKPTTVREWLEQLPDGYRERAMKNCARPTIVPSCSCARDALLAAFTWSSSPEGSDFWAGVCRHIEHGEPLPPLPVSRIAAGHNPDKLTEEQVGTSKGWRLLEREEIHDGHPSCPDLEIWIRADLWSAGYYGDCLSASYRTKKPKGYFLPKKFYRAKDGLFGGNNPYYIERVGNKLTFVDLDGTREDAPHGGEFPANATSWVEFDGDPTPFLLKTQRQKDTEAYELQFSAFTVERRDEGRRNLSPAPIFTMNETKTHINDGGPAFPVTNPAIHEAHGMTLRDWFAGQALAGYNAHPTAEFSFVWENTKGERRFLGYGATPFGEDVEGWHIVLTPLQGMAESMYAQADAMLAARAKEAAK